MLLWGAFSVFLFSNAYSQSFDGSKKNQWFGGEFSLSSHGMSLRNSDYSSDRLNIIQFSPVTRFFPANHFCIGPKFGWTGIFSSGEQEQVLSFGGELGVVYGLESIIPYLLVSPHESISIGGNGNMFSIPITAGIMIPLKDVVGLQFEVGVSLGIEKNYTYNTISIGIGICGLGEKSAVSFLNRFSAW